MRETNENVIYCTNHHPCDEFDVERNIEIKQFADGEVEIKVLYEYEDIPTTSMNYVADREEAERIACAILGKGHGDEA